MGHDGVVREEFARQSAAMDEAKIFTDGEIIEKIVSAVLGGGGVGRVLDAGCGPGILSAALAPRVGEVRALDITSEMIARAEARVGKLRLDNVGFEVGSVDELPYCDGFFDVVVTRLMLHHLVSPSRAVEEMARVLRRGGRLVVADIITSENPEEARLHNALEMLRDPSHVRALPASELLGLMGSPPLRVVAREGWVSGREYGEWIRITNSPERAGPLLVVMGAFAAAGQRAGIGLRGDGETVRFDHTWELVTAEKV